MTMADTSTRPAWEPPDWFTPIRVTGLRHGDNIFAIGAACTRALRMLGWPDDGLAAIHAEARRGNYDHACEVYGRFVRLEGADE